VKVRRDPNPVLPPGRHTAVIHRADEKTSKSGNPMMKLSLKVSMDGQDYWINEYVLSNRHKTIDAILEAIGYPPGADEFDAEKLEGTEVTVVTKIEEAEGYEPQARVERWVPKRDAVAKAATAPAKVAGAAAKKPAGQRMPADDDIPF
jgi:hypothetical protein